MLLSISLDPRSICVDDILHIMSKKFLYCHDLRNRHLQKKISLLRKGFSSCLIISLDNILNKPGLKLLVENLKIMNVLKPLQGERCIL